MKADEIMTEDVVSIRASQPIEDAIEALSLLGARHLPVLGDAGQLVGMISDRDLRSLRTRHMSVADVMSTDIAKAAPSTSVSEVIDAMLEAGVGALPVVEEHTDTLVGIVSYVDVLRALRSALADPEEP